MYSARRTIENDGGNEVSSDYEESSKYEGKMEVLKLKSVQAWNNLNLMSNLTVASLIPN